MTKLKEKIIKITNFCLDLIFPKICFGCRSEGFYLCQNCLEKIPLTDKFSCYFCGQLSFWGRSCEKCQRKFYLTGLISACSHQINLIREAIKALKYEYLKELVQPLSGLLIKCLRSSHFFSNFSQSSSQSLVLPIPLHRKKFLERGFNQAGLIGQEIAREFDLEFRDDLLIRVKNTISQTELEGKKRFLNVQNVFAVKDRKVIEEKIIFLIDDVVTTGATLSEAAKVLKRAGAKEVWGLTITKG
ncbi:MAG: ComF family protein [Patescibacteria group bacterium]|nr:ComF family protein [Patescibacteria group bacterium]